MRQRGRRFMAAIHRRWWFSTRSFLVFDAHGAETVAQGVAREAEQARGLTLVAASALEGFADDLLLPLLERPAVWKQRRSRRGFGLSQHVEANVARDQFPAIAQSNGALDHVLEFPHVAGPIEGGELGQGFDAQRGDGLFGG